jgi:uncharacterized membrane protein
MHGDPEKPLVEAASPLFELFQSWHAGTLPQLGERGFRAAIGGIRVNYPKTPKGAVSMLLTGTTTIARPPRELYDFWKDVERLPTFMAHLEEVRPLDERVSRWTASAPFGRQVSWDAEVVQDEPGRRISWRSLDGADVENRGSVRFDPAPGGRGTEVHVEIEYSMPAGRVGELVAKYFGEDPHQQLDDDLRRFKQVIETGEIVRSDGAPSGKHARGEFPQHPAQPLSKDELAEVFS